MITSLCAPWREHVSQSLREFVEKGGDFVGEVRCGVRLGHWDIGTVRVAGIY